MANWSWGGSTSKANMLAINLKSYRENKQDKNASNGDWETKYTRKSNVNTCTELREKKADYKMLKENKVRELRKKKKTCAGHCIDRQVTQVWKGKSTESKCKEGTEEL